MDSGLDWESLADKEGVGVGWFIFREWAPRWRILSGLGEVVMSERGQVQAMQNKACQAYAGRARPAHVSPLRGAFPAYTVGERLPLEIVPP